MEDVSVSFDGFKAINDLNFYVDAGELRCVIGPNGAGKTTMMDIITGKTRPDKGSCWFGQKYNSKLFSVSAKSGDSIGGNSFSMQSMTDAHKRSLSFINAE